MIVHIVGKNYGCEGFSPCGVVETAREAEIWMAAANENDFYTVTTSAVPEPYLISEKHKQEGKKKSV